MRDVTCYDAKTVCGNRFLLTRPVRDVTSCNIPVKCDNNISTHTPREGRDALRRLMSAVMMSFLLTRPVRDVTCTSLHHPDHLQFLLTRPVRDVTYFPFPVFSYICISTHTPREGRDIGILAVCDDLRHFYSHAP